MCPIFVLGIFFAILPAFNAPKEEKIDLPDNPFKPSPEITVT
jgi:hypothetical protein